MENWNELCEMMDTEDQLGIVMDFIECCELEEELDDFAKGYLEMLNEPEPKEFCQYSVCSASCV